MSLRRTAFQLAALLGPLLLLSGCATPESSPTKTAASAAPAVAASAASSTSSTPPTITAAAFSEAVARAGTKLIAEAQAGLGEASRELIIDPLIDGSTGQQTTGSVQLGEQLITLIKARSPKWNIRPLSRETIGNGPLLLIGTLTAINTKNTVTEAADAFRICLTITDLRTGRIVAKQVDRATAETVQAEPMPFFRDSPTWQRDKTVLAYIKSCQGSSKGDSVDPAYLIRLPAEAVLNEAITAYTAGRFAEANRLYREASLVAEPDDLRVLNGLYLTHWKLGKRKDAMDAFGKIVGTGLDAKRLPIKLLFTPSTTNLLAVADLQTQYSLWLREVAQQIDRHQGCLKVVGHTSRTGNAAINDSLSQRRAATIEQSLERQNRRLAARISSDGVGSRENLIGLGTDDNRDALDRRVEFRVVDCS